MATKQQAAAPRKIIRSSVTYDALGFFSPEKRTLIDIQGRTAENVESLEAAKRIMTERWSWVL